MFSRNRWNRPRLYQCPDNDESRQQSGIHSFAQTQCAEENRGDEKLSVTFASIAVRSLEIETGNQMIIERQQEERVINLESLCAQVVPPEGRIESSQNEYRYDCVRSRISASE